MRNKILPALLSLGIAIGIWLYVVTVVSPNSDKSFSNIPVVTENEIIMQERGFMITNIDVTSVSLHLGGTRTDLNNIHMSNITVSVDMSKIYQAGEHKLPVNVSFPDTQNSITVLDKTPEFALVTIEERISKPVPVDVQYNGTVDKDFVADKDNKVLDVTEINITGPKSVVDKIDMARIVVDLNGRNESINESYSYTLCDKKGQPVDADMVTTDTSDVTLMLKILRTKEIKLLVKVIDGGGATAENSVITMETESIWVSGSDTLLESLETLEIGAIDLGEIADEQEFTFPIKLPEGITDETGVTEVKVKVQFPELATKVFTVTEFAIVNLPAGYKAEIVTKALEITLRGPKANVDVLTVESVQVTADFTDTDTGATKAKVIITCSDPAVGEVGSYSVLATVTTSEN